MAWAGLHIRYVRERLWGTHRLEALAMGLHPRLGGGSKLKQLEEQLVEAIGRESLRNLYVEVTDGCIGGSG